MSMVESNPTIAIIVPEVLIVDSTRAPRSPLASRKICGTHFLLCHPKHHLLVHRLMSFSRHWVAYHRVFRVPVEKSHTCEYLLLLKFKRYVSVCSRVQPREK